ncbi:MAG TPA: aldo/keto reductase [Gammaproteobacteria bacterium]|jgi:voltage-dependent potassium channel beta subunit|nr:aldo/keto reductase [Gammaproteobacteria bacterium]HIB74888.1 aldo/keto reductase [Gammaproteobacteria bacterium]HIG49431.1 aldo/keto reductase [Gammaproteobacteria bacterium]HIO04444.1 aldo/keto reductase [Gammaproteobacteria bacterium]HIO42886.1 aldo/keto reductase [Gammaproteobacteria bacterium]
MEYRTLGKSGLKISELSFGSWVTFNTQVDTNLAEDMFKVCFDSGINFFDNAEGYDQGKSEEVMGQALKSINEPRDSYCVSSKVFFSSRPNPKPTQKGLSKKHITEACHQAMQRLQVDYLDLYFCHRADPETPIGETVWAMHNLITQGKILYWGTSEWTAEEITEAYDFAEKNHLTPPTMEQPQYNLLDRKRFEVEYDPIFRKFQMGTTIWSPLASGALTGKYLDKIPEGSRATLKGYEWLKNHMIDSERGQARMEKIRNLKPIADELGVSLSKMSIAWCLLNPNVSTVILGASKVEQLKENLESLEVVPLLTDEIQRKLAGI